MHDAKHYIRERRQQVLRQTPARRHSHEVPRRRLLLTLHNPQNPPQDAQLGVDRNVRDAQHGADAPEELRVELVACYTLAVRMKRQERVQESL